MRSLIFGATGYVGSAVARAFKKRGYGVDGVARSPANRARLEQNGITPVKCDLDDPSSIRNLADNHDVLVFAAMMPWEQEVPLIKSILAACAGSSRTFIYTSGTGVLSLPTLTGDWDENSFAEDDPFPFEPTPDSVLRFRNEALVRDASNGPFRTFVVRPPLIWGNAGSIHIPQMFESARKTGAVCYLGRGLNLYSNIHVDDLAEVYVLAAERGASGALYHAVAGEVNFRSLAEAIADVVGCEARALDYTEACVLWGAAWVDLAMAVNSRCTAPRTRNELGWRPVHLDLVDDIRTGSYHAAYVAKEGWAAEGYVYSGAHGTTGSV